jgi:hypothetical protein
VKNLIIQYYIDTKLYDLPEYNNLRPSEIEKYSSHSFKQYAKRIGADYIKIEQPILKYKHPTWERLDLWLSDHWWEKYDKILYVDSDVVALPHAPDVFSTHPDSSKFKVAAYRKWRESTPSQCIKLAEHNPLMKKFSGEQLKQRCFQCGVFILTKNSREQMLPVIKTYKNVGEVHDGLFLNYSIVESNVDFEDMSYQWNVKNNGQTTDFSKIYFVHCAGQKKHQKGAKIWQVMAKYFPDVTIDYSTLSD